MKFVYLISSLLAVITLSACSEHVKEIAEPMAEVDKQVEDTKYPEESYVPNPEWETLKVGSETSYEPFEFKDKSGLPIGFEIDLIREIGKAEEFNVDIFDYDRKNLVNSFDTHDFSIWASALSIKPKRVAVMDLSDPIITTEIKAFVLANEDNKGITSIEDLKDKKFAVSKGASTSTLDEIAQLSGNQDSAVFSDSFFLALESVYTRKADVILADKTVAAYYMQSFPEFKIKEISLGKGHMDIAFAVQKGDIETLQKINEGLSKLKENGTHQKLVEKWFGNYS